MPKNFLYYLLEEDGRSIKVQNGVVTSTSTKTPLDHTPDKWQEISVAWERDLARHGIHRNFSTLIEFVRDGAHIIREAFYNTNVERRMYLLIQRLTLDLDSNFFQWVYRYFYKGEIDMSTCDDSDYRAKVNIMEGKLNRMLNAAYDTVFEFDVDTDTEMKVVRMDGIVFNTTPSFALVNDLEINSADYENKVILPMVLTNPDTSQMVSGFKSQEIEATEVSALDYIDTSENWFAKNESTYAQELHITGKLHGFNAGVLNGQVDFKFLVNTQSSENDYQLGIITNIDDGEEFSQDVDITITLQPGEKLFFFTEILTMTINFFEDSILNVSGTYRHPITYSKGLSMATVFKRLVGKITGNENYAQSALLDLFSGIILMSGDNIRSIAGGKIKTSLSELFTSADAVLCAGLGIENDKIIIEDRDHFYDDSDPISLGTVRDCKRTYAKELMANKFKVGYPETNIENVNGKYSVHNSYYYTTPLTRVVKEHTIQSKYLADPYLIETIRANLDGKATTDDSRDNRVFMIGTEPDQATTAEATVSFVEDGNFMICSTSLQFVVGQTIQISGSANNDRTYRVAGFANLFLFQFVVLETIPSGGSLVDETDVLVTITWLSGIIQQLTRVTYDSVEGIPAESVSSIFNVELFTPKRMLLRHGKWIRAMLHGFEMDDLVFQTTEKNPGLKTTLGAEVIDEDADIPIGDLDEPLFIPKFFEFDTETPIELVELFEANANRCFEFIYNGVTYKGFNIKSALMPNTLQPQSYKLLSVVDNDFSEFVY